MVVIPINAMAMPAMTTSVWSKLVERHRADGKGESENCL